MSGTQAEQERDSHVRYMNSVCVAVDVEPGNYGAALDKIRAMKAALRDDAAATVSALRDAVEERGDRHDDQWVLETINRHW